MTEKRRLRVFIWVAHHLEAEPLVREYVAGMREVFSGHDVEEGWGEDAYRGRMKGVEVLVCWGFAPRVLDEADSLKWIQFGSAGINHALTPELRASSIRLTTQTGLHAVTIAEYAVAGMLMMAHGIQTAIRQQAEGVWDRGPVISGVREFSGSTVGVAGMGHIGRAIASRCRALGARVIATASGQAGEDEADVWVAKDDIAPLLGASDYVVLALPQTSATEGLLGEVEIGLMKTGAVLVNVARGVIVDEDALVRALREGRLGGAVLDVFRTEPLPPGSPLWRLPNVVITPHTSGATPEYGAKGARTAAANLRAYLAGERMPTEFDREKGY
mgnify:CR=1 FL=1|jgi:phosphoglycerate dehydrogenase-like enzyme